MKKLLFMMLAVVVFAGCSKEENEVLSEGDKITRSIEKIDTPLMEVLEGKFWSERAAYTYTESNGEGEEIELFKMVDTPEFWLNFPFGLPGFYALEGIVINQNQLIKYVWSTPKIQAWHYFDYDITKQEDNTFIFTRNEESYYLKVIAYNNDYLWIETDCYNVDKNYMRENGRANSYPYVRLLFKCVDEPALDSVIMSEDEIKEDREKNPNNYPFWTD